MSHIAATSSLPPTPIRQPLPPPAGRTDGDGDRDGSPPAAAAANRPLDITV